MDISSDWAARSRRSVWHPCTVLYPGEDTPLLPVHRAQGVWLYDHNGKAYLDAISSWWTNLFGHANPRINQAIKRQLDTLDHVMLAGFTHEPVVQLSEALAARTGGELGHCSYASDGSSAVEIALKMSYQYWQNQGLSKKQGFIRLQDGYHGETVGAMGVSDVAIFRQAYGPLLGEGLRAPSPDARQAQDGESADDVALKAIAQLEALLAKNASNIAGIIVEPLVQCAAGMIMYSPLYLKRLRALCDHYQVHFIADEIAVGFGRTGRFFACEHAGVWPDFLCLSKGITGGYLPLSAVLTRPNIYDAFVCGQVEKSFLHSHSYTGNALACQAALATLAIFDDSDVLGNNKRWGDRLEAGLQPLLEYDEIKHFRRQGSIFAFDVHSLAAQSRRFATTVFLRGLKNGVLLRPLANTVYLMPPYVLNDDEVDHLAAATVDTVRQCLGTTTTVV